MSDTLTTGKVSYTRSIRPADYETRSATVELTWVAAENGDYKGIADLAQAEAFNRVHAMLRHSENTEYGTTNGMAAKDAGKVPEARASAAAINKVIANRRPGRPLKVASIEHVSPIGVDPAEVTDVAEVTEDFSEIAESKLPPTISDADVLTRVQQKQEKIKNGPAIRALLRSCGSSLGHVGGLPQERRKEFLDKLEELT